MKRRRKNGLVRITSIVLLGFLAFYGVRRVYLKTKIVKGHQVLRVIDGDTLVLSDGSRLRLLGVNTPEHGEDYWIKARDLAADMCVNKDVKLMFLSKKDYYHRKLGDCSYKGKWLTYELVKKGLAHVMLIPPYNKERARILLKLQDEARKKGLGIWKTKRYRGPLHITTYKVGKRRGYLRVANISGRPVDLGDFFISNGKQMLRLPHAVIPPGETALIYSTRHKNKLNPKRQIRIYLGHSNFFHKEVLIVSAGPSHKIIDKVRARRL